MAGYSGLSERLAQGARDTATGTGLRHQASPRFTPSAQTTAGFRAMVSSRISEKPAWARAAPISRPQAAEVSSLAPGPRG